jgi:hypothetical protein
MASMRRDADGTGAGLCVRERAARHGAEARAARKRK